MGSSTFSVASLLMERDLARQIQFLSWRQLFYVLTELLLEIQYRLDTQQEIEISSNLLHLHPSIHGILRIQSFDRIMGVRLF